MRERLKIVWKNILTKNYSDDTVATIMYLLAKTTTPEETLNTIIDILEKNLDDEKTYQSLTKLIDEKNTND